MMNARLLALVGLAASTFACSQLEQSEGKSDGWECVKSDVPMGEVIRCTGNTGAIEKKLPQTSGGGGDSVGVRTYDVPQPGSSSGGSSGSDDTSSSSSDDSGTSYDCSSGSSPDCPNNDAPPTAPPSSDSNNQAPGPDECGQVPDLPYCGGTSTDAPSTPSTPSTPPGGPWKCEKEMSGQTTCESAPSCSKGSHPSKCGACVMDGDADDCVPPSEGGCWVTGGGFIVEPSIVPGAPADGHDNFGGNAKQMKKGGVQGHWNHVDHGTKNHAKGKPEYIYCRHVDEPGPGQPGGKKGFTMNQIYFGGPAEWRSNDTWADGYWFDVVAKDHGEPGSQPSAKNGFMVDNYHFTIRKMDDPANKVSGAIVYEVKGGLVGGNIQIHPPNPGHPGVQSPLPKWVSLEP